MINAAEYSGLNLPLGPSYVDVMLRKRDLEVRLNNNDYVHTFISLRSNFMAISMLTFCWKNVKCTQLF